MRKRRRRGVVVVRNAGDASLRDTASGDDERDRVALRGQLSVVALPPTVVRRHDHEPVLLRERLARRNGVQHAADLVVAHFQRRVILRRVWIVAEAMPCVVGTVDVPHNGVRRVVASNDPGEFLRVCIVPVKDELHAVVGAHAQVAVPREDVQRLGAGSQFCKTVKPGRQPIRPRPAAQQVGIPRDARLLHRHARRDGDVVRGAFGRAVADRTGTKRPCAFVSRLPLARDQPLEVRHFQVLDRVASETVEHYHKCLWLERTFRVHHDRQHRTHRDCKRGKFTAHWLDIFYVHCRFPLSWQRNGHLAR